MFKEKYVAYPLTKNIQVPRHVIAELMREMDQEGQKEDRKP